MPWEGSGRGMGGGCSGGTAGGSADLKVGVIPVAHRLDPRVFPWLLRKDVEAGTDPACPTGMVRWARGWESWVLLGLTRGGLWSSCRSPSPLPGRWGGVTEGGSGLAPLQAPASRGYDLSPGGAFSCPCAHAGRQGPGSTGVINAFLTTLWSFRQCREGRFRRCWLAWLGGDENPWSPPLPQRVRREKGFLSQPPGAAKPSHARLCPPVGSHTKTPTGGRVRCRACPKPLGGGLGKVRRLLRSCALSEFFSFCGFPWEALETPAEKPKLQHP